jgi:putative tricarboxylic transport membrane protein
MLMMVIFGLLGYLLKQFKYEPSIFILAFVLGPRLESSLRQTLLASEGNFYVFFQRPISMVCLGIAIALISASVLWPKKREMIA